MESSATIGRRVYIDWARGIAVLLMVAAHTSDAWTRAADKSTIAYRHVTILGGFAAPLFLWLAGISTVLSATRTFERTGSRAAAVDAGCRRGIEIFLLAFLFRLQALVLSPGGPLIALLRVDVLNVMGPAIVLAALAWAASRRAAGRVAIYAAVTAAIGFATPIVRASPWIDVLPAWLQWYLRPAGEHTMFSLFPWSGFVFAGAAAGVMLAAARDAQTDRRVLTMFGITGGLLIAAGLWAASRPTIYTHAPSSFWTSSPAWFAIRVGVLMTTLFALSTLRATRDITWRPLTVMGRGSLFIYWIHVELVYGYASWLWRHRLPLWGTAVGFAGLTMLMYGAVVARDRYLARKTARISQPVSLSQA